MGKNEESPFPELPELFLLPDTVSIPVVGEDNEVSYIKLNLKHLKQKARRINKRRKEYEILKHNNTLFITPKREEV